MTLSIIESRAISKRIKSNLEQLNVGGLSILQSRAISKAIKEDLALLNGDYTSEQKLQNLQQRRGETDEQFANTTSLPPIEDENNLPSEGDEVTLTAANKSKIKAKYAVVDVDDLIISNNSDGSTNPEYPKEFQPRDRKKETSITQIQGIGAEPDFWRVAGGKSTSTGAPIIGIDLVVESGNGRAAGIKLAYKLGNADEYKEKLIKYAGEFKVSVGKIKSMRKPILVRIRTTQMTKEERIDFTIEAGTSDVLGMAASEQARGDGKQITDEMLAKFYPESNLTSNINKEFVLSFIAKIGNAEAGKYLISDGYSKQLYDRIQAAIFSKAYNDDRLLALMSESTDKNGMANIITALNQAAPSFVRARAISHSITSTVTSKIGDAVELSLDEIAINALIEATKILKTAKESGMELEEYLKQSVIFEGDAIDPVIALMAVFIKENNRSATRMGIAFQTMAEFVENELERRQNNGLWVDDPEINLLDVLKSANEELKKQFGDKANTIGGGASGGFMDLFTGTRGQEKDRTAFLEQNKHLEMLRAIVAGDYDSEDSESLLNRIETAANSLDSKKQDALIGQAMDKWFELDNRVYALDSAETCDNKTLDWNKLLLKEKIDIVEEAKEWAENNGYKIESSLALDSANSEQLPKPEPSTTPVKTTELTEISANSKTLFITTTTQKVNNFKLYYESFSSGDSATRTILNRLRQATSSDSLEVIIDSYGGRVDDLIVLMGIFENTFLNNVVTYLDPKGCSCGALLFCMGIKRVVLGFSTIMFHDYSTGAWGKSNEIESDIEHTKLVLNTLFRKVVLDTNFLSPNEFEKLKDGKDFWFDTKEMCRRNICTHVLVRGIEVPAQEYIAQEYSI